MKARTFLIGTSYIILLAACSGADGMGPRVTRLQDALTQAKVSLRHSVEVGEASVTGGKAVNAALLVDAAPEYSVGALGNGTLHDVRLDIVSGSVIASNVVGASADPCPGSIPLAGAIGIAEARMNGTAVSVQSDDDDQCLREVQVLAGDVLWEVKLARDGAVLETEKSDADGD
ncbi:MAG: PepSY domain-containing protein [Gemmatimonadales bacterium]